MAVIRGRKMGIEDFRKSAKAALRPFARRWNAVRNLAKPNMVVFSDRPGRDKRVLLCYLLDAAAMKDSDPRMKGHANWWRGREIARILDSLGYNVDVIAGTDSTTFPTRQYDIIFDASNNLPRLAPFQKPETKYAMLLTGSHHGWSGPAEATRIADFERRHGVFYLPRYGGKSRILQDKGLAIADMAILVGNEVTKATYPEWARRKIVTMAMPTSEINHRKSYANRTGTFLYYSSGCNVMKGLDLVLDAMAQNPEWRLNVVGPVESGEQDFMRAYPDLRRRKNIRLFGSLNASSNEFARILDESDAALLPSCSEGTSSSMTTCLRGGIYPIISRNSGIDLPDGAGTWIEELTVEGVERAIEAFLTKDWADVAAEAEKIRAVVEARHSREAFTRNMTELLKEFIETPKAPADPTATHAWLAELPESVKDNPLFGTTYREPAAPTGDRP